MASKRPTLTFPELDNIQPKGRHAILRSAEEIAAEQALLEGQESGQPESQNAGFPASQHSGEPVIQQTSNTDLQKNIVPESQQGRNPGSHISSEPGNQSASKSDSQKSRHPASRKPAKQEIQEAVSRDRYQKVTYRLSFDAIDAIEDAKRILKRQYGVKASMEEIAEEAILAAYQDLLDKQEASNLVRKFAGKPANKK
jgi:hypothetical protein